MSGKSQGICLCGAAIPPIKRRITCGAPACQRRRSYLLHRERPAYIEANRERNRRWAQAKGLSKRAQPWLLGVPTWAPHVPGDLTQVLVLPDQSVEFKDAIGLHGALSRVAGVGHGGQDGTSRAPIFSLIPGDPWHALWLSPQPHLYGALHEQRNLHVGGKPISLYMGMPIRQPNLPPEPRGAQLLQLDTLTPLILPATRRTGKGPAIHHRELTSETLEKALRSFTGRIFGKPGTELCAQVLEDQSEFQMRRLPGHWGMATMITGRWKIRVNAPAARILRIAQVVGLGSRIALGYGRIVLSPVAGKKI